MPGNRYPAVGGELSATADTPTTYKSDATPNIGPRGRRKKRGPKRPEYAEPLTRTYDIRETDAYTPTRNVEINSTPINADRDIKIRAGETGPSNAEISLWNPDAQTAAKINTNDQIDIYLGWRNTESPQVFRGNVITKRRRRRGGDREFKIHALASDGKTIKGNYSRSFNDATPHRIVEDIINNTSVGRGYVSTLSTEIGGYYTLSKHKTIREWLDRLVEIASEQTDRRWIWYVEDGDLYFHPAVEQVSQSVELSYDKSILRATPVGSAQAGGEHPHEIAMRCEPSLRRGMTVTVPDAPTMSPDRRHRIKSYVFESSTTRGRHHTTVTTTPLVARDEIYD